MTGIDDVDKAILGILQEDAKITPKEIADKLHLSRTPIVERIKKLERMGIIQKYIALLNPLKINKGLMVICFVSLKEHGKERVLEFEGLVANSGRVTECLHIAGNYDFILKVFAKNVGDYYDFVLNELSEIKNIGNVQSSFVLGKLKYEMSFDTSDI